MDVLHIKDNRGNGILPKQFKIVTGDDAAYFYLEMY